MKPPPEQRYEHVYLSKHGREVKEVEKCKSTVKLTMSASQN